VVEVLSVSLLAASGSHHHIRPYGGGD